MARVEREEGKKGEGNKENGKKLKESSFRLFDKIGKLGLSIIDFFINH